MPSSLHIPLLVASGLQFITVLVPVLPGTVNLCAVAQPVRHADMKSFPPESSDGTSKILSTREIKSGFLLFTWGSRCSPWLCLCKPELPGLVLSCSHVGRLVQWERPRPEPPCMLLWALRPQGEGGPEAQLESKLCRSVPDGVWPGRSASIC